MSRPSDFNNSKKLTWLNRFSETIAIVCGKTPPKHLIVKWLTNESDELQDWIGEQSSPWWLQNIGVIDMAQIAADNAIEGVLAIDYENPYAQK